MPGAHRVERRHTLEDLVSGSDVFAARPLADDGLEAWAEVQRRGLEGLVAVEPALDALPLPRWHRPLSGEG